MTRIELLRKALTKAYNNGCTELINLTSALFTEDWVVEAMLSEHLEWVYIFDPRFAIAFWGEEEVYVDWDGQTLRQDQGHPRIAWQYYLQQMIVSEDPLEYLRQFLEEDEENSKTIREEKGK